MENIDDVTLEEEDGSSAGHQLGQLIGDWWERDVVLPLLRRVASELDLYLDNRFIPRQGRVGDKIHWKDEEGNVVDYDFVLELNGTPETRGVPVGFIEVFWRRGARHSKDKARDDSGKLGPMKDTYPTARYLGISASGELTKPARTLLHSREIDLFFIPKKAIIQAFEKHGLVMDYPDRTKEEKKRQIVNAFRDRFSDENRRLVAETLFADLGQTLVDGYVAKVTAALSSVPVEIRFTELMYSDIVVFETVSDASRFLENPQFTHENEEIAYRYEIDYSNGGQFEREVGSLENLRLLHAQLVQLAQHMEGLAKKKGQARDTAVGGGKSRGLWQHESSREHRAVQQGDLFTEVPSITRKTRSKSPTTFVENLAIPIHNWFRFSAGFSAVWTRELIRREKEEGRTRVLDPFSGSGTVVLESEVCGSYGLGIEAHPFIARVAKAKLKWREEPHAFSSHALSVLQAARDRKVDVSDAPKLVQKCFEKATFEDLSRLIDTWRSLDDGSPLSELTWLALVSIIRSCSTAGTAQWQYVLPNKQKKRVLEPFDAFQEKVALMVHDMHQRQSLPRGPAAHVEEDDARACTVVDDDSVDLIITSPPYANNYDYADATRLELTVLGEIERWADLHEAIRQHLLPSCTQHVTSQRDRTFEILEDPILEPIKSEMRKVCEELERLGDERRGKKAYHTLIASYFKEMARVWYQLRRVAISGARVCFVVGDSAPYGVYVPVDRWLGELAIAAGFLNFSFEKTRDRNVKWKNRKHRVPLHEGYLWVQG